MTHYYVCTTPRCVRNKPRLYVREETVKAQGHVRCLECNRQMERRTRPLKGPNTKRITQKSLGLRNSTAGKGPKATHRKYFRKKWF